MIVKEIKDNIYNEGGKDFTIYFRGDNIDYKLHYSTSSIEISYA